MFCKTLPALVIFAALTEFTPAIAADEAGTLVENVAHKAHDATMWEAEGQLITGNAVSSAQSKTEIPFRVSLEYPADASQARARLEITGGENPLVRICDGHLQWTYLLVPGQYWKVSEPEISACAYPYTEWVNLAVDLRSPVIVGKESLNVARGEIKCTVVRGDFSGRDPALAGSRTLWIEDRTGMVWQYRVERTGGPGSASVQTYTLFWQTRDFTRRSADLFQFQLIGGIELSAPPTELEKATEQRSIKTPIELPKNLYRIGGIVTPPTLIHKVEPKYTKAAQNARIEGRVILRGEILPDGTARNLQVTQSLDPGLDQKAIEAVSQWRFRPGVRDGNPVAVAATFEINFRLR